MKYNTFYTLMAGFSIFASACGGIKAGTPARATDPVPDGTVEAQATLTAQNGATVSGSVSVYNTTPDNVRVLRIDDLSIPVNSQNRIFLEVSGQVVFTTILKSPTGNQNYPTGITTAMKWTQAVIRQSANVNDPTIAAAIFIKP